MASSSRKMIDGLRLCPFSPLFRVRRLGLPISALKSAQTSMSTKMIDPGGLHTKVRVLCWRTEVRAWLLEVVGGRTARGWGLYDAWRLRY
ncbi:hypothetical protein ES332_A06G050700v1 [Gossypium tomentosum]|uniref:Uncharacterized protein n=1 Tax=Gossypium tomentosum TaxID=34277 RepID=A0A5D2Q241_GOSTO|nr:hypothetical protein ES332_A06G050700v1 [Gossypium tomentosum]